MKRLTKLSSLLFDFCYYFLFGGVKSARRRGIQVGNNCRIYNRLAGSEPFLISIGDNVTITSGVRILTHDGSTCLVVDDKGKRFQRFGKIIIGSDVFIGINTIILPGITLGNNVVVGAGSVVTKDVPSGCVYAGNPARYICSFEEFLMNIRKTCLSDFDSSNMSDYQERVLFYLNHQRPK